MARLIVTSGVGDIIDPSVHRCSQLLDTNQARSQAGALKRESLTCWFHARTGHRGCTSDKRASLSRPCGNTGILGLEGRPLLLPNLVKGGPGWLLGPLHSYLGRYLNRVEPTPDPHPQALAPAREEPTNVRDYVAAVVTRLTFAPCVRVSRWHAAFEARSTLALAPVLLLTNTKLASSTDAKRPRLLYASFSHFR